MSLLNHIPLMGDRFVKVAVINKQVRVCFHQNESRYVDIGMQDLFSFMEWAFTHTPYIPSEFKGEEFTVTGDCTVTITNQLGDKYVTWSEIEIVLLLQRFPYISAAIQYWQSQIQTLQTLTTETVVDPLIKKAKKSKKAAKKTKTEDAEEKKAIKKTKTDDVEECSLCQDSVWHTPCSNKKRIACKSCVDPENENYSHDCILSPRHYHGL